MLLTALIPLYLIGKSSLLIHARVWHLFGRESKYAYNGSGKNILTISCGRTNRDCGASQWHCRVRNLDPQVEVSRGPFTAIQSVALRYERLGEIYGSKDPWRLNFAAFAARPSWLSSMFVCTFLPTPHFPARWSSTNRLRTGPLGRGLIFIFSIRSNVLRNLSHARKIVEDSFFSRN